MKHLEAVLKMQEPGYSVRPISIRRSEPNPWSGAGRSALDVLRAAPGPMTAREIAEAMPAAKGITGVPRRAVSNLGQGRLASFQNHKDGAVVVVVVVGEGLPARWTLK